MKKITFVVNTWLMIYLTLIRKIMNKRALYCTVICLYLSFSGFAQVYEDFNLSEYVTPDIVRSQLDFSLRTAGSFTDNETSKKWFV